MSNQFVTGLHIESQSSTTHIHDKELLAVAGGRVHVPFPHGSVTVEVTHSGSVPKGVVAGVDHGDRQLTGVSVTGEVEERIPLRVKTFEPHDLFRQPIRFDISYEQHLGAKLLTSVPQGPQSVRLSGVFSYPRHTPTAAGALRRGRER